MDETSLTTSEREAFLAEARIATLSYLARSGNPLAIPVWFEWDGNHAQMFADRNSAKVRLLKRDPRASLLIARPAGQREEWVAIDGTISVTDEGATELFERLAGRYWDLSNDYYATTLAAWRDHGDFVRLELVPGRIRSYVTR